MRRSPATVELDWIIYRSLALDLALQPVAAILGVPQGLGNGPQLSCNGAFLLHCMLQLTCNKWGEGEEGVYKGYMMIQHPFYQRNAFILTFQLFSISLVENSNTHWTDIMKSDLEHYKLIAVLYNQTACLHCPRHTRTTYTRLQFVSTPPTF